MTRENHAVTNVAAAVADGVVAVDGGVARGEVGDGDDCGVACMEIRLQLLRPHRDGDPEVRNCCVNGQDLKIEHFL